ncbi:SURF1 family cytochrome oxidase biogenesis protein, partial [Methylopila musalis]
MPRAAPGDEGRADHAPAPQRRRRSAARALTVAAGSVARRVAVVFAATRAAFALPIGLGSWQLQRLKWKTELVARIEART